MTHKTIETKTYEPDGEEESLDGSGDGHDEASDPKPDRRRWWIAGGGVVLATAAFIALNARGGELVVESTAVAEVTTAEVVRTDLVQNATFEGTLGTVSGEPITTETSGIVTDTAAVGTTVVQGDVLFRIDDAPVVLLSGVTPAYRTLTLGSDTLTVFAGSSGVVTEVAAPGTLLEQGDIVYWLDGEPVVVLYGDTPAYRTLRDLSTNMVGQDVLQLERALVDLGFDPDGSLTVDGEFTGSTEHVVEDWQEAIGADDDGIVDLGYVLFVPGPSQIVDILTPMGQQAGSGTPIMTLSTGDPQSGSDVAQLEEALTSLGFDVDGDLTVDGMYTSATYKALVDWQTATGQTPDGVVTLGEIVFLPGSIRVEGQIAAPGTRVNQGAPVLSISSSEQVVRVEVPAADQGLVTPGDSVTVVLPGFVEVPGTVVSVSSTAIVGQDGEALFEVIVELDDPDAASGLDEAPVDVNVVADSVTDVLAVPVTALVVLAEGGYAVEVDTGAGFKLVAVDPGFFGGGLVEVTSADLQPGDLVVIP